MSSIKKVLIINSFCGSGSTGRIVKDLFYEWKKRGVECTIAYGRGEYIENDLNTYKIGNDLNVISHGVLSRVFDSAGFESRRVTKRFIEWIDEYKPDLIHLHNLHGYYINIKILFEYISSKNITTIWTLHDCWGFTGHCAYFSSANCDKWINGCYKCTNKHEYPRSIFLDNCKRNYHYKQELYNKKIKMLIITPSEWLKGIVRKSILSSYPVVVQPNGIDLTVFKPQNSKIREKYGLNNKKILLGVANVWDKRKGLDLFIELSQILDEEWRIVLIGLNKNQIKSLPKEIIGIERITNIADLVNWYSAADVYLNSSTEETMGLTTVEAQACGTPVVAFGVTAIPEMVDKSCGKIVDDYSPKSVWKAVKQVNKNVEQGLTPNVNHFSNDIIYSDYIDKCVSFYSDRLSCE